MEGVKGLERGLVKKERLLLLDIIFNEHSYTKPFQAHPDFNRIHSAKVLNFKRQEPKIKQLDDEDIDVTTVDEPGAPLLRYDDGKVRTAMLELEKCLNTLISESTDEDERILRSGWTMDQAHLFDQVYKSLLSYQLARLTYEKNPNEPVLRRLALDKAVKKVRSSFASISWDSKLTSWLHTTLIDGLGSSLFLCYLEILQGLKAKVPALVERLFTMSSPALGKRDLFNSLTLTNVLKKSWEPSAGLPTPAKAENLPGQQNIPYILVIPSGPSVTMSTPKRARFWQSHLSAFGRTVPVNMHTSRALSQIEVKPFLENMISAVRSKVAEFKNSNPERKLVLVGWHIGALVACEVALLDTISAIVCLGFPCVGLNGIREVSNDPYQEVKAPVMFVLGSHSTVSPIETVEALRERMKTSTQLVVVEGGDDLLKLHSAHKRRIELTQSMVDKLVIDEIQSFLRKALSPDQSKATHSPGNTGSLQSCKSKADRKRKVKRALITKHTIDQKKKKKAQSILKVENSSPDSLSGDAERFRNVSIPFQRASLAGAENSPDANLKPEVSPSDEEDTEHTTGLSKTVTEKSNIAKGSTASKDCKEKYASTTVATTTGMGSSIVSALRSGQARVVSKRTGKPLDKIGKRPKSRKILSKTTLGGTGAFTKVSQAGTITLQSFPPGSVLLSGAGSHVRFHRGTSIFYVPSSSGPTPIVRSSSLISSASPKARQVLVTPTSNRPITAIVNSGSGAVTGGSGIVITGGVTTTATTSSVVCSATASQDASAKPSALGTQLSQTDIQYLANIISKQKQSKTGPDKVDGDKAALERAANSRTTVSPISTKISIGTISNLNATEKLRKVEAAHGMLTRELRQNAKEAPRVEKISPENSTESSQDAKPAEDATEPETDAMKDQALSNKGQYNTKVSVTLPAQAQGTKTVPVTLTIPLSSLPGNFAIQPNSFSLKALPKGSNAKFVSKINTTSTSTLSALLTQQKFVLSSVSNSSNQVGAGKFAAVVSKEGLKTSLATTPSSFTTQSGIINATVQGGAKPGQIRQAGPTSLANFVKAPATITLHLPSSAILRDPKFGKDGNSQIKFIGLLNAQGRSPVSSPIHFSNLKARSAPVSPSEETPTVSGLESVKSSPGSVSQTGDKIAPLSKRENGICSPETTLDSAQQSTNTSTESTPEKGSSSVDSSLNAAYDEATSVTEKINHKKGVTDRTESDSQVGKLAAGLCVENDVESDVLTPTEKEE